MPQEITGWGLDLSNYSGVITKEWAERRVAEGWTHGIASTQDPAVTRDQLDDMSAGGLKIAAYVFMYASDHGTARQQIDRAIASIGGRPIERLWLDFEGNPDEPPPGYRNRWDLVSVPDFVEETVAACVGRLPGYDFYTSRAWWVRHMGEQNDTYKDYRLWLATADGNPNLDFKPFGGWERLTFEQYVFDQLTDGINCDWNVMGDQFPAPTVDDFGRGKREVFNEWVRNEQRHRDDMVAREDAHLAWVKARETEWSIP
jgi:hypothetical protein